MGHYGMFRAFFAPRNQLIQYFLAARGNQLHVALAGIAYPAGKPELAGLVAGGDAIGYTLYFSLYEQMDRWHKIFRNYIKQYMDRQEKTEDIQPSEDQKQDKLPSTGITQNPNPRANENIRYRETKEENSSGIGSEITDGEDA